MFLFQVHSQLLIREAYSDAEESLGHNENLGQRKEERILCIGVIKSLYSNNMLFFHRLAIVLTLLIVEGFGSTTGMNKNKINRASMTFCW